MATIPVYTPGQPRATGAARRYSEGGRSFEIGQKWVEDEHGERRDAFEIRMQGSNGAYRPIQRTWGDTGQTVARDTTAVDYNPADWPEWDDEVSRG